MDGAAYNGAEVPGAAKALMRAGAEDFAFTEPGPTAPTPTPTPDPSPNGSVSGLHATFGDDFDSFSWDQGNFFWNNDIANLDWNSTSAGTWKTLYDWGNRSLGGNAEQQYYSDASVGVHPFSIQDGALHITAAPSADPSKTDGLPYTSGAITTQWNFEQTYGFFEIRAEIPAGQGLWPAFWMLQSDHSWPPEIDVLEAVSGKTTAYSTVHSSATGEHTQVGIDPSVPDLYEGFHTFGVSWRPDLIEFYVDGNKTFSTPTPADMHEPMYLLANLAVGGHWPGAPDATTPFPAEMVIDYIRAWQYDDLA